MVHGWHGVFGRVVMFLVEGGHKQEVEPAQTLLQLMEGLLVWEMKPNHRHATAINAKVNVSKHPYVKQHAFDYLKFYLKYNFINISRQCTHRTSL